MSHTTPATYLVWSIVSSLLGIFLVYHLWCFDRFKCLRWNQGSQGTFKRVMTYTYLLSVPLIITYSVGFCIIKYSEGYQAFPGIGITPTPHQLWTHSHSKAILPLYLCLSVAWGLEMVTHLEELCFWLFVVNAGSVQTDWFRSLYYKTWIVGSSIAVLYMPLVTIFTRSDPLKCEAYTFLAGSLGSLSLTLWFMPVLHLFRPFLNGLRREGVDMNTIIRLTKFHELNTIRVLFRLLFALPLLILAIDGIRPHQHVNDVMFWTDILTMAAGFGVVVSSGLTLVIFFPRSIEGEITARSTGLRSRGLFSSRHHLTFASQEQELYGTYEVDAPQEDGKVASMYNGSTPVPPSRAGREGHPPTAPTSQVQELSLVPNRRQPDQDIEMRNPAPTKLTADNLRHLDNPVARVSNFVHNFRSPIDFRGGFTRSR
ncbi:hypothetical protein BC834DRAFT_970969 [Gloeopeniophorella convolvens]|nr:hypothetical protein BC834DRAFT_970969 [Gloeopeniophorella convolvens]